MDVIKGKIDCLPEETGYDSARVEVLDRHFERMVEGEVIFGAQYCVAHKGKIIINRSIGAGDGCGDGKKMTPGTILGIASITKTFTAVAIMQLVEDGFVRLNTPVGEIIPAFDRKPFDGITLWHLLTHTSGLYPDGGCLPIEAPPNAWELIESGYKGEADFDWITAGISPGLRREPGTEWAYCSFGFCVLGEVIARVTGMSAADYITARIIKPLGMNDSGFELKPNDVARAFYHDDGDKKHLENLAKGINSEKGTIWERIPPTDGGLYSNATDLIKFANTMLYKGTFNGTRILGRKAAEKMTEHQLFGVHDFCWGANEPNRRYGVGFDMREGSAYTYSKGTFMHEGAGACSMDIDPQEELCAAWFVPFNKPKNGWSADVLYNVQSIIWSGLK